MEVTLDNLPVFVVVTLSCLSASVFAARQIGIRRDIIAAVLILVASILGPTIFGIGPHSLRSNVSYWLHFCRRSGAFTPETKREFNYDEIRSGVLLGRQPRHLEDLERLKRDGVVAVVSLNEPWELFVQDLPVAVTQLGMAHMLIPTPDFQGPELSKMAEATEFIRRHLHDNAGKVYVHCNAGKGRSAVVVAAYLAAVDCAAKSDEKWEVGVEVKRIVEEIRAMRPQVTKNLARYPITGQSRALNAFVAQEVSRLGKLWEQSSERKRRRDESRSGGGH